MKKVLYILGGFEDQDIEWIISNGVKERIASGTVLIEEGKPIEAMYIILDGSFSVTVGKSKDQQVARLGAGEILGEMSYVDSRPPSATVTAIENAIVIMLYKTDVTEKLRTDVGFSARFYHALAVFLSDRLRSTTSRLGYGESDTLEEDVEYEDELDMDLLDNVSMAGARFEQILRRFRDGI